MVTTMNNTALNISGVGCIEGVGGGNLRERYHLEDPGVDGRIILR